jgi:hypothetical protein
LASKGIAFSEALVAEGAIVFAKARELLFEGIKTRWEARGAASGAI